MKNLQTQWNQAPMVVIWEITRACALACRHCRAKAIPKSDPHELDFKEAEAFIDQVVRAKPQIFILTGGDPMYRQDLVHLIDYAAKRGLRVAMSPSATPRFLKADLRLMREAGLRAISLSLDGAAPETHDFFRGVRGTFDWTMQAFEAARQVGIDVQINTTFTRGNIGEFDQMVELTNKIQPKVWSLFQLVPTGRARMEEMLSAAEMENLFNRLYDLSLTSNFDIKTTEGQYYRRVAMQRWRKEGGRRPVINSVNDGKGFVFVSHTGEIYPSGFLPLSSGNVRVDELRDVYANAPVFRELRNPSLLKGKCGICEFNNICGGSRARAYAVTGDYLAQEPLCDYQPQGRPHETPSPDQPLPIWRMYIDD